MLVITLYCNDDTKCWQTRWQGRVLVCEPKGIWAKYTTRARFLDICLCSHKGPILWRAPCSGGPRIWFNALVSPFWNSSYFLNKAPAFSFCTGPHNYVAGPIILHLDLSSLEPSACGVSKFLIALYLVRVLMYLECLPLYEISEGRGRRRWTLED